jgi:hypothetical protein
MLASPFSYVLLETMSYQLEDDRAQAHALPYKHKQTAACRSIDHSHLPACRQQPLYRRAGMMGMIEIRNVAHKAAVDAKTRLLFSIIRVIDV